MYNKKIAAWAWVPLLTILPFIAESAEDQWAFEVVPYIWGAGIDADVTVNNRKTDVDVGFDDLIDKVDLGGSLLGFAQKGRWVNWLQMDYFDLSDDETADRIGGAKIKVESKMFILTMATGVRIDGWMKGQTFDILGGVRYTRMDNEIKVSGVGSADRTNDIVDGIIALRPSWMLGSRWEFTPAVSVGAGDSDLTYELQPWFKYKFNETWAGRVGYRRLYYDYDKSNRGFDGAIHGFILGVGARF